MLFLLVAFAVELSAQCAMCKATVESNNSNGGTAAGGINDGIIYLMFIPYILLAFFFRKRIFTFLKELRALWN
ncbi:MAG: hypothetical protein Fur0041_16970 [Bacteroidia bacterium]